MLVEFIFVSIYLDFLLLWDDLLKPLEKLDFIFKKYFLLLKAPFVKFKLGESSVNLFGRKFFYESVYGLGTFQGALARHKQSLESLSKKDTKIIFDIGANVGTFSLMCSRQFPKAQVYAFEPIPTTFSCLKSNCESSKNVRVFQKAAGNQDTELTMDYIENVSFTSKFSTNSQGIKVESVTLNRFLKENKINHIDLLKIDVETYENFVLEGASDILKNVRYILIEVTIEDNPNYTISDLFSLLKGKGYNFQLVYYRNARDKSYGSVNFLDCLLVNQDFK